MPKFSKAESCLVCPYKSEYLKMLPTSDVELIQNNCLIVQFKKGETISKQNTKAAHALYLAQGCVKIFYEGKGKNTILGIRKQSGYIALHTLWGDEIHRYSIEAVKDCKICLIDAEIFKQLSTRNPLFLLEVTKQISETANTLFDKVIDMNEKHLKARLADVIINLSENIFESTRFEMPFTRRELAEMGAMSTENAVRTISELKKDEIIAEEGKFFEILQMDILRKLSEIG